MSGIGAKSSRKFKEGMVPFFKGVAAFSGAPWNGVTRLLPVDRAQLVRSYFESFAAQPSWSAPIFSFHPFNTSR